MRHGLALAAFLTLALAACEATPPPCRNTAAAELRQLDALIAETRANLDRGYALGPTRTGGGSVNFCVGGGGNNVGVSFCTPGTATTRTGPVAIDPAAERRKLAELQARRDALARRAAAELAACEAGQA